MKEENKDSLPKKSPKEISGNQDKKEQAPLNKCSAYVCRYCGAVPSHFQVAPVHPQLEMEVLHSSTCPLVGSNTGECVTCQRRRLVQSKK